MARCTDRDWTTGQERPGLYGARDALAGFLIAKADAECLRGQELTVYAWRALALPRLGCFALAFFEIAVESLDQVLNCGRIVLINARLR